MTRTEAVSSPAATTASDATQLREHALRAIDADRTPGYHFAGHFLDVRWLDVTRDGARLLLPDASQCRSAGGAIDVTALSLFVDTSLSTVARRDTVPGARLGTIYLQMQFTDEQVFGDVVAETTLFGLGHHAPRRHAFTEATLSAGGKPFCRASGEFLSLEAPPGTVLAPLPWQRDVPPAAHTADESTLSSRERQIMQAIDGAIARRDGEEAFIDRLWHGAPASGPAGATRRVVIGPHMSNRVGHVQGGILAGIAVATARDALPLPMALSNLSAWYISPGRGKVLYARSRPVHAGRSMAVVRTEITTGSGTLVLEAVTQHMAASKTR